MKKCDIHICVVINESQCNDLQQPHALQVVKQVDSDQGRKLSRFRAYLPLVIGLLPKLIEFISDKLGW